MENISFCLADKPNLSEMKKRCRCPIFLMVLLFICVICSYVICNLEGSGKTSPKPAALGNGNAPLVLVSWKWGILLEMEMK